jgi:hypothetical protein
LAAPVQTETVARVQQEPPRLERDQQPIDADSADVNESADQLPRTASPLALAGLLGVVSLAGVAAMRVRRRDRF